METSSVLVKSVIAHEMYVKKILNNVKLRQYCSINLNKMDHDYYFYSMHYPFYPK